MKRDKRKEVYKKPAWCWLDGVTEKWPFWH